MQPEARLRPLHLLKRFALLRPYRGRLVVAYLLLLITAAFQLFYPHAVSFFIDRSVAGANPSWLGWAAIGMSLLLLVHSLAIGARHFLFASTGSMVVTDLRNAFFGAVLRQDVAFFERESVGDLTSRLSVDIEKLQEALTVDAAMLAQTAIIAIGATVMLFMISPPLSMLIAVLAPLVVWSMRWVGGRARTLSKMKQERLAQCGQLAQEVFSNIRLVHAFTQEDKEKRRFDGATSSALGYSLSGDRLFAGLESGATLVQGISLLIAVLVGGALVAQQALTLGEFTKFLLYAGMAAGSATTLGGMWGEWMRVVGATDRVFELLSAEAAEDAPALHATARLDKEIRFEDVEFRYPSRPDRTALRNFSLTIRPGEKIAFVGASGAGKSTIINLVLGFHRPTAGRILIGGVDMEGLCIADVRRQVAIVEQEPALFSMSILDNIRYGCASASVTDDELLEAARSANVVEFAEAFPDRYETCVGARGAQLSGGQKQRVAIARALIRDPRLLILDEATSALDAQSEAAVQDALSRVMAGRTTIIIAHRLSTIRFADRIVVLREGEIVQCGSHDELMTCGSGYYQQLVSRQMAGAYESVPTPPASLELSGSGT
ncbi:MAG: ABC transporter transmembrane domain-containing protein [Pseudomonadota bacterium]|nr:ABC transporter transmembrane domain-containing protein [Pseudomonadota bacterium]